MVSAPGTTPTGYGCNQRVHETIRYTRQVTVIDRALQLDPNERLELISLLWDSLVDQRLESPVDDEQRQLLRRRLREHRADPSAVVTWDEAKRRLGRFADHR